MYYTKIKLRCYKIRSNGCDFFGYRYHLFCAV